MRNKSFYGTPVLQAMKNALQDRLLSDWSVELTLKSNTKKKEAYLTIQAPDRRQVKMTLDIHSQMTPREAAKLINLAADDNGYFVLAPFLSPRTRELLSRANINYFDSTGNLRLVVREPAIFIESHGLERDPDWKPRALKSLKGPTSGRIIRALCDFLPPYGVRTLANMASTPPSSVSRVIHWLEEEALLIRNNKKIVTAVDWVALISQWVRDYHVITSNVVHSFIEPRGLAALGPKLTDSLRYAATGSLASSLTAPTRLAMLYVNNVEQAAQALELIPSETGANVWLLEPFDNVVFERTKSLPFALAPKKYTITTVAPSQAIADLMTSPGRGPQEAVALLEKMKGAEHGWRQKI